MVIEPAGTDGRRHRLELRRLAPPYYSGGQPLVNGWQPADGLILPVAAVVMVALGVAGFRRRDVATREIHSPGMKSCADEPGRRSCSRWQHDGPEVHGYPRASPQEGHPMPDPRTSQGWIEYRLVGTGPVVMILKGGHSSRMTRLGHERLTEHNFSVLEPSRPGYDGTPRSVGCTAQSAADALVDLLDELGIQSVSLVAISAAGHTGIELARRHPDRIERVSFESAVALPWSPGIRRGGRLLFGPAQVLVWGATRAGLRLAPELTLRLQLGQVTTLDAGRLVREMDAATRDRYLEAFRSLWSGRGFLCDLEHDSPSDEPISQPALIMRGTNDPSVPRAHAARLEALCRRHETLELDAETHFIWFGHAAEQVWQRRLAFLTAASSDD
jgi:pimeloyl-ACP methyl ester carboxylesterase